MLFTFDMKFDELLSNLKRAGLWFPIVMLLWVFIYMINALSWYMIINDDGTKKVPFLKSINIQLLDLRSIMLPQWD